MVADKGKKIKLDQKLDVENNPQGKKIKLDQKLDVENKPEELDGELVLSVEKLQEIQDELEKINEEASDKVLEIEQTYNVKRRPVYEKRSEIVKSIPDFWLTAFLSHPVLGDLLTEEDKQIFKYLNSLDVEDFKDVKSGYSITFNFNPNPYFEDTQLTKTFAFQDEGTTAITSTSIKWKEGMGLANGVNHEKKGNKQPLSDESFFQWFKDESEQKAIDPIGDEIAEIIKEDLWPNPLAYFNNDPDEDMDSDEEGGEDDDEDEDEEDN